MIVSVANSIYLKGTAESNLASTAVISQYTTLRQAILLFYHPIHSQNVVMVVTVWGWWEAWKF